MHQNQGPQQQGPYQQGPYQQDQQGQRPGQFQQFHDQYGEYLSNQRIVAAAACGLGGIIVIALSILGGAGASEFLDKAGYGWISLFTYLMVVPMGYAIWKDYEFVEYAALGLIGIEGILEIILSYAARGVFPEWLFLLKAVIFALVAQLVWEFEDEDDHPQPPRVVYRQAPQQQGPAGPQPRRRQPPGPRN